MSVSTSSRVTDAQYIHQAMFTPGLTNVHLYKQIRHFSTASMKFTDTTPGGSRVMNPPPQMTRTADIKNYGISTASKGLGRYYSEVIDDNLNVVTFQFGVPETNSLRQYLGTFYNPHMATLTNRGEHNGLIHKVVSGITFLFTLPLQGYFLLANFYNRAVAVATGNPYSKFYYMKQTMALYWNGVATTVNEIAVVMGIGIGDELSATGKAGGLSITDEEREAVISLLPDVITHYGNGRIGINVFAIANRAQRLAIAQREIFKKLAEDSNNDFATYRDKVQAFYSGGRHTFDTGTTDYVKEFEKHMTNFLNTKGVSNKDALKTAMAATSAYVSHYTGGDSESKGEGEEQTYSKKQLSASTDLNDAASSDAVDAGTRDDILPMHEYTLGDEGVKEGSWMSYIKSEMSSGSSFVSFAVEGGDYSESFTNSVKTSSIAEKLKGISGSARDTQFTFANGNLDSFGLMKALKDVAFTALDAVTSTVGINIGPFVGNAYVDIPKVWDDSSTDFSEQSYKIRLQSIYGNKLSVLFRLYLTLAMLINAAAPRSTGKRSYTSPFICSIFSEGKVRASLCMIKSLQISRAVGNIGFTVDNLPNAIDINISIANLDEILHVPVTHGLGLIDSVGRNFDETSEYSNYLSTLGALSMYDQFYAAPRLALSFAKIRSAANVKWTKAYWSSTFISTSTGRLLESLARAARLPQ